MNTQKEKILKQYSSSSGSAFYRCVMGAGSDHIHYGLYKNENSKMIEALEASCARLLELAKERIEINDSTEILDLGAGAGGPAKYVLAKTPAKVCCLDIGLDPLLKLEGWAKENNLSSRLSTSQCSFENLNRDWHLKFDLIWSQDALCHSANRAKVFSEVKRVLKPNGIFVFSDILLSENAPEEYAKAFTSVNAVQHLGTKQEYLNDLKVAGLKIVVCEDWSQKLEQNFRSMLEQLNTNKEEMLKAGVEPELIKDFSEALRNRLTWKSGTVLNWHAFVVQN
jgi:SAM-dependent methyltransferase